MKVEQELELYRKLLSHMMNSKSLYTDEEIIAISKMLDKLIVLYYSKEFL